MPKIVVTPEVRKLIEELHETMEKFADETRKLGGELPGHEAVSIGADREHTKARIIGVANRIYHASKPRGKK